MLSLWVAAFVLGLAFPLASGLLAPLLSERREDPERGELSFASPVVVSAFLCGAGGSGSLISLTRHLSLVVTAGTAALAGVVLAMLVVTLTRGLFPRSGLHDADLDL